MLVQPSRRQPPDWVNAMNRPHTPKLWFVPRTNPNPHRMATVGAELRALRKRAGMTQREVATKAGFKAHTQLAQAELGKHAFSVEAVTRVLDALDADAEARTRILGLVREDGGPGRLDAGVPGAGHALQDLIAYEHDARRITDVALGLIPGLLQTSEYARAIMGDDSDARLRIALRMGRRDVLTRDRDPVELVAYIDSEVLVRPIAPPDVMRDQLRFLLDMGQRPNITIRLVSSTVSGWHPMLAGPFELIEFGEVATPVVLLEHHRSSLFLWQKNAVADFLDAASQIEAVAMTPAESAEAIAYLINGNASAKER